MGLSFDILIFDCLLKAPQPITGLFLGVYCTHLEKQTNIWRLEKSIHWLYRNSIRRETVLLGFAERITFLTNILIPKDSEAPFKLL